LDETLVAILDGTIVGSVVGVYPIMATEIRLAIERLIGGLDLAGHRERQDSEKK
jgi:hypothetical protein